MDNIESNNTIEENKDNKLLGVKKERETKPNYFTEEDSYNNFEYKNKYISTDVELIKSYSKNIFERINQSPIEIINIIVWPYINFNQISLDTFITFLEKIKDINTTHKKIIKYIYNNGTIHNDLVTLPSENNNILQNNLSENNGEVINSNITNPNFVSLNTREIAESINKYKWEGIIKIIIFLGESGFIKQVIKNIDCYHNNYLIINMNKITSEEKNHFNNIINNKYSFQDLINYLKQDIYEHSIGKNNIKEISDKFNEYNDLLKRYINYDLNNINNNTNLDINYLYINFIRKNIIKINRTEWALFDANSSSKTYIGHCFTSKLKKNSEKGITNFLNPELVTNQIEVELTISNNIYKITNNNETENNNNNFHINDLTLKKKMIGELFNKIIKSNYNQEFYINTILLDYALCDYICDLFNIKLLQENININLSEIHFYQCQNYIAPFFIAKEYPKKYVSKYNKDLYECFSHFSYCISSGKILIENIKEYDGKIYDFDIYKDTDELNSEENLNIFRFFCYHKCNKFCEVMKLNNIDINFYDINNKNNIICDICKIIFDKNKTNYEYNKDNLYLCSECHKKIYESKYERVCVNCGNIFTYYYFYYILQKKETPTICELCKKIELKKEENNEEKIDTNNI